MISFVGWKDALHAERLVLRGIPTSKSCELAMLRCWERAHLQICGEDSSASHRHCFGASTSSTRARAFVVSRVLEDRLARANIRHAGDNHELLCYLREYGESLRMFRLRNDGISPSALPALMSTMCNLFALDLSGNRFGDAYGDAIAQVLRTQLGKRCNGASPAGPERGDASRRIIHAPASSQMLPVSKYRSPGITERLLSLDLSATRLATRGARFLPQLMGAATARLAPDARHLSYAVANLLVEHRPLPADHWSPSRSRGLRAVGSDGNSGDPSDEHARAGGHGTRSEAELGPVDTTDRPEVRTGWWVSGLSHDQHRQGAGTRPDEGYSTRSNISCTSTDETVSRTEAAGRNGDLAPAELVLPSIFADRNDVAGPAAAATGALPRGSCHGTEGHQWSQRRPQYSPISGKRETLLVSSLLAAAGAPSLTPSAPSFCRTAWPTAEGRVVVAHVMSRGQGGTTRYFPRLNSLPRRNAG